MSALFYNRYVVIKDTPYTDSGTIIKWDLWRDNYTTNLRVSGFDENAEVFTKEFVESKPEWFEPIGSPRNFYDVFPDDIDEHYYFGELKHNKMCSFCTVAQSVIESKEYQSKVTAIFKNLYENKIIRLADNSEQEE